jgi:formylglycine-generating enzyme required for sulfatase activity
MTAHALFIGVDEYEDRDLGPLGSAVADATDLHALFKRTLGYGNRAVLLHSPNAEEVREHLRRIGDQLRPRDRVLIYFAGHGMEAAGSGEQLLLFKNFKVGRLPEDLSEEDLDGEPGCLSVRTLVRVTSRGAWADNVGRVLVLDACRVPPGKDKRDGGATARRGRDNGLTDGFGNEEALNAIARNLDLGSSRKREKRAPPVTPPAILKSCRANHKAWELNVDRREGGVQPTGVFCKAWTQVLEEAHAQREPVRTDAAMLRRLRETMAQLSRQARLPTVQEPWISDNAPAVVLYEPRSEPPPPPSPPNEDSAWATAQAADTVQAYERFLLAFPAGRHAAQARQRIDQLHDEAAWTRAQSADTIPAYARYLAEFPAGRYAERAQARIASLRMARGEADAAFKRRLKAGAVVAALVALVVGVGAIWPGVQETRVNAQREQAARREAQEQQRQERERLERERAAAEERAKQAEARAEQERRDREQAQKEQAAAEARVKAAEAAGKREQDAREAAARAAASPPPAPARAANPGAVRPAPGTVLKDCDVCPPLVVLPRGSLTMGSPASEPGRDASEGPQRVVTIGYDLAVGRYEVTQREWTAVMGSNPSKFNSCHDCPVESVSWDDAQRYLAELNRRTVGKLGYRLLSEAEWEYMARGVTRADAPSTAFWWGNEIDPSLANYDGNYTYNNGKKGEYRQRTTPVGTFKANPFGAYDAHGNVHEWVQDVWHENYTGGAPLDGTAWTVGGNQNWRVLRGGSWKDNPRYLRSANRHSLATGNPNIYAGLRIARALP